MQLGNIDFSDKQALIRKVLYFFPIFVLVNLVIVYVFTDIADLLRIRKFYPGYLLLAAGIRLIPWFSKALRLQTWMRFLGHKFTYREGVHISVWSELGVAITPTSIGGQPMGCSTTAESPPENLHHWEPSLLLKMLRLMLWGFPWLLSPVLS